MTSRSFRITIVLREISYAGSALTDAFFMAIVSTTRVSSIRCLQARTLYICSGSGVQPRPAVQYPLLFLFLRKFAKWPTSPKTTAVKTGHASVSEVAVVGIRLRGAWLATMGRSFFLRNRGIRLSMPEYVDRQGRDNAPAMA